MTPSDELKKEAARQAVDFVVSGMVLGLGTGSTANFALELIAERLKKGKLTDIVGIPTSVETERLARELGIPLTTFDGNPQIDLTIDGADEIDPELNLLKGCGGALLREKIVAAASQRQIIVVDESKLSAVLGTHRQVPVEVLPFGWQSHIAYLESVGARVTVRREASGGYFQTDQSNMILDCDFGRIAEPARLAATLKQRAGIIEHGLFIGCVSDVIVAGQQGIRHLRKQRDCEESA